MRAYSCPYNETENIVLARLTAASICVLTIFALRLRVSAVCFPVSPNCRAKSLGPGWFCILRFCLLLLVLFFNACGRSGPPFRPAKALETLKIEKGFRIDTFVTEPDITSPVAMEFDEDGRIYVVEMPGYPLDTRPTGRIKLLEDTNGDGRPDRSRIFADGLVLPTGVMRWKKGILVTAAPDVWYFEDTDGDGRADVRRKVLTGFPFTNPQHTVNGPLYGLDNWIYLAHEGPARAVIFKEKFGDPGSEIRFADHNGGPVLKVERRGVRFRPDSFQLEYLSGNSQYGHYFDEWGHYFTVSNSNHVRHEVIAARYLERNPDLPVVTAMQDMSDHENAAKVFPITHRPRFEMLTDVGQFTSACSLTLYLGGAFPPQFRHVSFVAEPAHNLVHTDVWSEAGSTYVAKRLQDGVEFLASTDSWFRPVNFYIGPDGALYLVDYYRPMIEHPEWTSSHHHHDSKELYVGSDRGRIYRIVPDSQSPLPLPRKIHLGKASDEDLVQQLANPDIWWRRTAQRLLVDRQSAGSVEPLIRLLKQNPSPLARLHALWTLEGLGKLDASLVEKALEDSEPGIRENAIRLAEQRLTSSPSLLEKLLEMGADPNPKVRFQLLCTLGFVDTVQARAVQDKLLMDNIEDEWMQLAALSASSARASQYFEMARKSRLTGMETKGRRSFFQKVCSVIGARQNVAEIQLVLKTVADRQSADAEWWRAASLEGLARGVRGKSLETTALKSSQELLLKLFEGPSGSVRRASLQLLKVIGLPAGPAKEKTLKRAVAAAADESANPELRADAVGLLALAGSESQAPLLKKLVDPKEPEPVQAAAVRTLGQVKDPEIGTFLLARWRTLPPHVRSEAADALESDPSRTRLLLNALKNEEVQSWTLNFTQKSRLLMNQDPAIRDLARDLLEEKPGEREKLLKRYEAALDMDGDLTRGEQVFKRACSKCHKKNGVGAEVGPDLGTVKNRPAPLLLSDILMPSKSIAQNYETYVVELASGGTHEGVMGSQTPTTITLRREEGKETVIPRKDIKRIYVADLSAMPDDLDKQVNVQQMADLLQFLTASR